jgi:hypothetical protein
VRWLSPTGGFLRKKKKKKKKKKRKKKEKIDEGKHAAAVRIGTRQAKEATERTKERPPARKEQASLGHTAYLFGDKYLFSILPNQ